MRIRQSYRHYGYSRTALVPLLLFASVSVLFSVSSWSFKQWPPGNARPVRHPRILTAERLLLLRGERTQTGRISLNEATVTELVRLKGIGYTLASRIVEYRQRNGPFRSLEEVMKVKGIGEHKFNTIRSSLVLSHDEL